MSLPVPTNPVELSYAAFQARVDANRPARDNGWDHLVNICLRQVLARDPPPVQCA